MAGKVISSTVDIDTYNALVAQARANNVSLSKYAAAVLRVAVVPVVPTSYSFSNSFSEGFN